jgi:hypothetical protein
VARTPKPPRATAASAMSMAADSIAPQIAAMRASRPRARRADARA